MTFRAIITLPDGTPLVKTMSAEAAATMMDAVINGGLFVGRDTENEAEYLNFAAIPRVQFQIIGDDVEPDFTDATGASQPPTTTGTTDTPGPPAPSAVTGL